MTYLDLKLENGKVIAFTTSGTYTDTKAKDTNENIEYEVVPYALNLSTGDKVQLNSLKPSISVQQKKLTLKLNEKFDAKSYAKAFTNEGEDITESLKVESNVDTTRGGNYEVKYIITENNTNIEKIMKVEVVSDYDYLSDFEWKSATTSWGTPRRNSNIQGRINSTTEENLKKVLEFMQMEK